MTAVLTHWVVREFGPGVLGFDVVMTGDVKYMRALALELENPKRRSVAAVSPSSRMPVGADARYCSQRCKRAAENERRDHIAVYARRCRLPCSAHGDRSSYAVGSRSSTAPIICRSCRSCRAKRPKGRRAIAPPAGSQEKPAEVTPEELSTGQLGRRRGTARMLAWRRLCITF